MDRSKITRGFAPASQKNEHQEHDEARGDGEKQRGAADVHPGEPRSQGLHERADPDNQFGPYGLYGSAQFWNTSVSEANGPGRFIGTREKGRGGRRVDRPPGRVNPGHS